jgi:benzaldehyde dehydrogenase (NAD)
MHVTTPHAGALEIAHLLINGERRRSAEGKTFQRVSPLDTTLSTRSYAATVQDAQHAVDAAHAAFETWSNTLPNVRRRLLLAAAQALEAKRSALMAAITQETGASMMWAERNIQLGAAVLQEAAALTTQVEGQVIPSDTPGSFAMGVRQACGVVLGMAPWNAPVVLAVRAIATPLACGNTVILKGSEQCPVTHGLVVEAFHEAGFPPGVVNYLVNAPEDAAPVVDALVRHAGVRRVNFTGSTKVGKIIARLCADNLTPCVLELGGKAPLLVLADADLDAAVRAAAFGAFANSGQICMSTERIIVDERVADAFVARLKDKVSGLTAGDPRQGNFVLGSVIGMEAVDRCNRLLQDAIARGAELVCGGPSASTLMDATVLDRVSSEMAIYHEEAFGPVKAIIRVSDDDAAVRCANDTAYGLSAAVFSRDVARAMTVAKRIESGICHINGPTAHDEPQMPFGGLKASGFGRFGGKAGIAEFTDLRWISIQTSPRQYPF